jgi:hypothetical protein
MNASNRWGARLGIGAVVALALACASPAGDPLGADRALDPAPWTDLALTSSAEDFQFVIVSDRTGGHRPGVFEAAIEKINLLQPDFVVSVGDLIEGYTEDHAVLTREWDEIEGFVGRLQMPFFYAAGNHDYSNETMSRLWRDRFGPSYYHFRHRDVLFLVLNSEIISSVSNPGTPVPGPDQQSRQLEYVERVLAEHADARHTFVVIHQPLWDAKKIHPDWLRIEVWLGARPYTVFAGHHHRYTAMRRHDRRFVTLASTGGTSRLRGIDHGEFDHVMWVSMTDEGPVFANLMLDGIQDVDVRTAATRGLARRLADAITPEPFWVDARRFETGEARYALHNPLGRPLELLAELRAGRDLVPGLPEARILLEPGARETFVVPVAAREAKGVGTLAPAWIDWTLRVRKADGKRTELVRRTWILPDRRFHCTPAPAKVAVDGRLDEWSALPLELAARPGPSGGAPLASLRFSVACGDAGVYLAGEVRDPTPFGDEDRIARDQDAVSVLLDARPDADRNGNENFYAARQNGSLMKMLQTWLTPDATHPDPIVGRYVAELPEGVRQAATRTEVGYRFELAVPNEWLDARAGGPWDGFRLDLGLIDFDSDGRLRVVQEWRPSRLGVERTLPVEGSGSFVR